MRYGWCWRLWRTLPLLSSLPRLYAPSRVPLPLYRGRTTINALLTSLRRYRSSSGFFALWPLPVRKLLTSSTPPTPWARSTIIFCFFFVFSCPDFSHCAPALFASLRSPHGLMGLGRGLGNFWTHPLAGTADRLRLPLWAGACVWCATSRWAFPLSPPLASPAGRVPSLLLRRLRCCSPSRRASHTPLYHTSALARSLALTGASVQSRQSRSSSSSSFRRAFARFSLRSRLTAPVEAKSCLTSRSPPIKPHPTSCRIRSPFSTPPPQRADSINNTQPSLPPPRSSKRDKSHTTTTRPPKTNFRKRWNARSS
jgi:hypothetical protein